MTDQQKSYTVCTDVALKEFFSSNILHIWSIFANKFIKKNKKKK